MFEDMKILDLDQRVYNAEFSGVNHWLCLKCRRSIFVCLGYRQYRQ